MTREQVKQDKLNKKYTIKKRKKNQEKGALEPRFKKVWHLDKIQGIGCLRNQVRNTLHRLSNFFILRILSAGSITELNNVLKTFLTCVFSILHAISSALATILLMFSVTRERNQLSCVDIRFLLAVYSSVEASSRVKRQSC